MEPHESKVLAAFSIDHAARVTGLSKSRLAHWDRLGFFSPEYIEEEDRSNPYSRVYSFIDLVGLRALKILADDYRVPLTELKKAAVELKKRTDRPWSEIPLGVLKHKVVFDLTDAPRNVTNGQYALKHIPLSPIAREVEKRANELRHRDASRVGKIEKRKFIQHNAEVMSGTRIPLSAIESFIEEGYEDSQIVEEYPLLTVKDVHFVRRRMQDVA